MGEPWFRSNWVRLLRAFQFSQWSFGIPLSTSTFPGTSPFQEYAVCISLWCTKNPNSCYNALNVLAFNLQGRHFVVQCDVPNAHAVQQLHGGLASRTHMLVPQSSLSYQLMLSSPDLAVTLNLKCSVVWTGWIFACRVPICEGSAKPCGVCWAGEFLPLLFHFLVSEMKANIVGFSRRFLLKRNNYYDLDIGCEEEQYGL